MRWLRIRAGGVLVLASLFSTSPVCRAGSSIGDRIGEILGGLGGRGGGKESSSEEIRQALERQLRTAPVSAPGSDKASGPVFPTRKTLVDFYARRQQRLVWTSESGSVVPAADKLMAALERAGDHGLAPANYGIDALRRTRKDMHAARRGKSDAARQADFDLLLTTVFFRYASDLSTGRVHPDEVRSDW